MFKAVGLDDLVEKRPVEKATLPAEVWRQDRFLNSGGDICQEFVVQKTDSQ
jgi:hypothetical protein